VSTPSAPVEVGFVDTPGNALDVAVEGRYVYVADGESGGLRVIDVRTPSAPVEVGFLDTPGFAAGVAVAGGYAYVASEGGPAGLHVIDVRAPSAPVEVGFYDLPITTTRSMSRSRTATRTSRLTSATNVVDFMCSTWPRRQSQRSWVPSTP